MDSQKRREALDKLTVIRRGILIPYSARDLSRHARNLHHGWQKEPL